MRLVIAHTATTTVSGPLIDGVVHDVSARCGTIGAQLADPDAVRAALAQADRYPLDSVVLAAPLDPRARILCVGLNYHEHVRESAAAATASGAPTIFTRFSRSVVGHGEPLIRPRQSEHYDWEGEIGVVIGRPARHVSVEQAGHVIGGWTCVMDGSVRDYQRHSSQFTPGKNFDASGAIGPWIVTADELAAAEDIQLQTRLNGQVVQHASAGLMIHPVAALIAYCSSFMTLLPGDVIATGTPGGVGFARTPPVFLVPGDVVEVEVGGVGVLRNVVAAEHR